MFDLLQRLRDGRFELAKFNEWIGAFTVGDAGGALHGQMLMRDISGIFLKLHANAIDETYTDIGWQASDVGYLAVLAPARPRRSGPDHGHR